MVSGWHSKWIYLDRNLLDNLIYETRCPEETLLLVFVKFSCLKKYMTFSKFFSVHVPLSFRVPLSHPQTPASSCKHRISITDQTVTAQQLHFHCSSHGPLSSEWSGEPGWWGGISPEDSFIHYVKSTVSYQSHRQLGYAVRLCQGVSQIVWLVRNSI